MPKNHHARGLVECALIVSLVGMNLLGAPLHAASPIVIGEVAWAGSSLSLADEWIELWNTSEEPQSLAGLALVGASDEPIFFPDDALIPGLGTYLVANYDATNEKSVLAIQPNMVTTTLSLSNSALRLLLLQGETEIDLVGDGGEPATGSHSGIYASMVRNGDTWIQATTSQGFRTDVTDLGTPGICDGCSVTGTASSTSSSTEAVLENSSSTIPSQEITNTTSTDSLVETANTTSTETVVSSEEELPPDYSVLRLTEVMPQPLDEHEWVDIIALDAENPISLIGITIRDTVGVVFTFTTSTLDQENPRVRASLSSAHFNNGGDTIALFDPAGNPLDQFSYDDSEKGIPWKRIPDGTGEWHMMTVMVENVAPAVSPPVTTVSTSIVVPPPPQSTSSSSSLPQKPKPTSTIPPKPLPKKIIPLQSENQKPNVSTKKASSAETAPTKTSSSKTSTNSVAKTKTKIYSLPSFDMLTDESLGGVHVRLLGMISSPPGLLSGHRAILSAPDGRGLLVQIPTSRKIPAMGTFIEITGTISFDQLGIPKLSMKSGDTWTLKDTGNPPSLQTVDLMAPSVEDAWSLMQATGTVQSVTASRVVLETPDGQLAVVIKPLTHYRVQRLQKGDTLQVNGLLDMSTADPKLLVRQASDIELTTHAATIQSTTASHAGWGPFAAAGGAIATTEGVKRLNEFRKKRKLEKKLQTQ